MYKATGGLLGVVLACFFYSWGGRSGKWKRRFIASFILACTVNILCALMGTWTPKQLIIYPLLVGGFSLGYGADSFGQKIMRRSIYAAAIIFSGLVLALTIDHGALWVLIPHAGIGAFSIFLGVKNPIYAAAEEVFICAILNVGLVMYPFAVCLR